MSDQLTVASDQPSAEGREIIFALLILVSLVLLGMLVDLEMNRLLDKERHLYSELHYHQDVMSKDTTLWIEFTPEREDHLIADSDIEVTLRGFSKTVIWPRWVSWARLAESEAELRFSFSPGRNLREVGLFLTDGDDLGRAVIVRSGRQHQAVDALAYGRWVYMPVTEDEAAKGLKTIRLQALNLDIALAAVAVTRRAQP
ncbi:MAG: hypothetical protein HOC70_15090 [Gammaproteobacteria bacterium]|nr:hypothetical protein [Gammaproteobacteria bacterium]